MARSRISAACLTVFAALCAAPPAIPSGVYFVDGASRSCSDSGPGNVSVPYCTISAAVKARGGPSTSIYVRPGVYREEVDIRSSGRARMPLALFALGSRVIVDGADDFSTPSLWLPLSGAVWCDSAVTWNVQQVLVDGVRLALPADSTASLTPGQFRYVAGAGLEVNLGGDNPGTRRTLVGRRDHGFFLSGASWVRIEGFEVIRTEDKGIFAADSSNDVTIKNNRVTFCANHGIAAINSSRLMIESNVASDNGFHGIALISGVNGSRIKNNQAFRNARPAIREANGIYVFASPANRLERNKVHDNQDSGVNIQSGSDGCISAENLSWNNGDHGFFHLYTTGVLNIGNVAWRNSSNGFSAEGQSNGTRILDCIAVDNGLATDKFDLYVDTTSTAGLVSNYNIFWNSTGQDIIKYGPDRYSTVSAFTTTGQDSQSIQADPNFIDPAAGDFHLRTGSPAIDSGTSASAEWPAVDADGRSRQDDPASPNVGTGPVPYADRGALEYLPLGIPGQLLPGRPNPFNPETEIDYSIGTPGFVEVNVFGISGSLVRTLVRGYEAPGDHSVIWFGDDDHGRRLPSGTYFCRIQAAGGFRETRRLVLLR